MRIQTLLLTARKIQVVNSRSRIQSLLITTALAMACSHEDALQLVTEAEARQSQASPPLALTESRPADPQAPEIALVDPQDTGKPLHNPFNMEVFFKSRSAAGLDFSNFRAYYGAPKIDVTDRLLKEAVRTPTGIRLAIVSVPSGSHRILLQIRDSMNRVAEKKLYFRVE
jgi:hypothetical protein